MYKRQVLLLTLHVLTNNTGKSHREASGRCTSNRNGFSAAAEAASNTLKYLHFDCNLTQHIVQLIYGRCYSKQQSLWQRRVQHDKRRETWYAVP